METEDAALIIIPFAIVMFVCGCMTCAVDNMILLGDDVTTSDKYTTLFNDSFSGRVVAKDAGMYTVRDESGTERVFDRTWLRRLMRMDQMMKLKDDEIKTCPEGIGTIKTTAHTPNTILSMNASTAMSMSIRDEQGHPMIWIDNTFGVVWIMVSNDHQVPVNVADIENIETTYSYIDTFEYAPQPWTEKRETEEIR